MEFDISDEEKKLVAEVRSFIEREVTPELINETLYLESGIYGGQEARKFFKKFAVKGWLTPNLKTPEVTLRQSKSWQKEKLSAKKGNMPGAPMGLKRFA